MLTKEEAIEILDDQYCCHRIPLKQDICCSCLVGILRILKQQPEKPKRIVVHSAIAHTSAIEAIILQTCNDGTVFIGNFESINGSWTKLPSIPQDNEDAN